MQCHTRAYQVRAILQEVWWIFWRNSPSHRVTLHWRHNGTIASQITSLTIVYSTVYSDAAQRKYQSSASPAFVRGIHRGPVNSPHKWPVTRKTFPFDDVIMNKDNENGRTDGQVQVTRKYIDRATENWEMMIWITTTKDRLTNLFPKFSNIYFYYLITWSCFQECLSHS